MDCKATPPGQLPPTVHVRAGEVRTIIVDLCPVLRQYELACGAESSVPCRTRFGNTLELTVTGSTGPQTITAAVRTVLGSRENTLQIPVKVIGS